MEKAKEGSVAAEAPPESEKEKQSSEDRSSKDKQDDSITEKAEPKKSLETEKGSTMPKTPAARGASTTNGTHLANGEKNTESVDQSQSKVNLASSAANSSKLVTLLREIDLEICESLPQTGTRDHDRAIAAMTRLTTLPSLPTAEELLICKELLTTLNNLRKYRHDETIRIKADLFYNRFKNLCLNANLSKFALES